MRAENCFNPQYISSAPAARAARNEALFPAGARMAGGLNSDGSSFMWIIIKDKHYKINPPRTYLKICQKPDKFLMGIRAIPGFKIKYLFPA
jgi:hypothetical protein